MMAGRGVPGLPGPVTDGPARSILGEVYRRGYSAAGSHATSASPAAFCCGGGTMTLIRCPQCGNCLGQLCADHLVSRHRGREIVAERPHAISCERCGTVWRPNRAERMEPEQENVRVAGGH